MAIWRREFRTRRRLAPPSMTRKRGRRPRRYGYGQDRCASFCSRLNTPPQLRWDTHLRYGDLEELHFLDGNGLLAAGGYGIFRRIQPITSALDKFLPSVSAVLIGYCKHASSRNCGKWEVARLSSAPACKHHLLHPRRSAAEAGVPPLYFLAKFPPC